MVWLNLTGKRGSHITPAKAGSHSQGIRTMWRPTVVVLLATTLVLGGCAAPRRPLLPPGADPNELAEAIAKRGRGEAPPEEHPPPPSPREPRRLTVWEKIGWTVAVILAEAGLAAA